MVIGHQPKTSEAIRSLHKKQIISNIGNIFQFF